MACEAMITPYLTIKGAAEAIDFYTRAFGAVEQMRMTCPQTGSVMHAELRVGDARFYLSKEFPGMSGPSPQTLGNSPVSLHLQVPEADPLFNRAVDAGATVTMPLADMFWGDRFGKLTDPYGHHWSIAARLENLSPEQIKERMAGATA